MRGNEIAFIGRLVKPPEFPIPMRGNEESGKEYFFYREQEFPIPMRGNESIVSPICAPYLAVSMSPIPMRGNEFDNSKGKDAVHVAVSDPHEG